MADLILPSDYHALSLRRLQCAISVIHMRYGHLLETLDYIAENGKADEKAEADGMLSQLKTPANVCLLVTMSDVFTQLGNLSDVLQAQTCDIASAVQFASAQIVEIEVLRNKRSETYFAQVWSTASDLASLNGIEMCLPLKRIPRVPSKLRQFITISTVGHRGPDAETTDGSKPSAEEHYRTTVFYPVMDKVIAEMERRFNDSEVVPLIKSISACHPDSDQFLSMDALRPLISAYNLDRTGSLSSQIDVCKLLSSQASTPATDIPGVISLLKPAGGFPDLRNLLQFALTVPVANVAAERSFSSMRKIRTYVRSSMKEQRLSAIAVLSIECDLAKNVDMDELVDIFAKLPSLRDKDGELANGNKRRIQLL